MVLYDFTASSSSATASRASQQLCHGAHWQQLPDGSLPRPCQSALVSRQVSSSATVPRPAAAPLRRPGQQQTSSVGEKYSGLASNLAHLGRIC